MDNGFDALIPPAMARKAEDLGVQKAHLNPGSRLGLSILAGAFIAFGACFATVVWTGAMPWGLSRLAGGLAFSLGLVLVVVGGAELFTGNNLIVMAWAGGRISTGRMLGNWLQVYAGNFIGALGMAVLVHGSGQWKFGCGGVGETALAIGLAKVRLGFTEAFVLGVLCNVLVCLAVWMTFSARTTTDRILAVVFPITAFVACGFEHSIANMYFIPLAILLGGGSDLTWTAFFRDNLLPVTLGNVVGGAVLVGFVYWWIYLRGPKPA